MIAWWNSLPPEQQIFYAIAFLSTGVLVLQLILGLIGADSDGLGASDLPDGEHPSGFGVFSVRAVASFFAGLGWVGIICLTQGTSVAVATVAGTLSGIALMAGTIWVMRAMLRLQESGTLNYANAVGTIGTVYVSIPAQGGPGGQVEVLIQGRTVFAEARTDLPEGLKPGAKVRITSMIGRSAFMVEPA